MYLRRNIFAYYDRYHADLESGLGGLIHIPLGVLFMHGPEEPPAAEDPTATLSTDHWVRVRKLFLDIDRDQTGTIEKVEIAAVHGAHVFSQMDENGDGMVTPEEWDTFFELLVMEKGHPYTEYLLTELEKHASVLKVVEEVVTGPEFSVPGFLAARRAGRCHSSLHQSPTRASPVGHKPVRTAPCTPEAPTALDYPEFSGSPGEYMDRLHQLHQPPPVMDPLGPPAIAEGSEEHAQENPAHGLSDSEWSRICEVYKGVDTDGNGVLDAWEIRAIHGGDSEGLFALMDADNDDQVTEVEFAAFFGKLKQQRGGTIVNVVLAYLEANLDRMQAEDEILALPIAALLLSDWENDDLPAVTSPQEELSSDHCDRVFLLYEKMDVNKDGRISKSEITNFYGAAANGIFSTLDSDKDGGVSTMEWLEFFARMTASQGPRATEHKIKQLERMATTIAMTQRMVGVE